MFKAVIFDMDGVLIDSEPLQLKRQKEYLDYLGVAVPDQELIKMVGGNKKCTLILFQNTILVNLITVPIIKNFNNTLRTAQLTTGNY